MEKKIFLFLFIFLIFLISLFFSFSLKLYFVIFLLKRTFIIQTKKIQFQLFSHYVIYWTNLTLFDRTFYFNIWKLFYDYFLIIKKRLNIYEDIWIDCSKKNVEWFLYFFIHTMKTTFLFKFWLLKSFLRTRLFGRFAPIFYFNF